jgi:hypothetical protein
MQMRRWTASYDFIEKNRTEASTGAAARAGAVARASARVPYPAFQKKQDQKNLS